MKREINLIVLYCHYAEFCFCFCFCLLLIIIGIAETQKPLNWHYQNYLHGSSLSDAGKWPTHKTSMRCLSAFFFKNTITDRCTNMQMSHASDNIRSYIFGVVLRSIITF